MSFVSVDNALGIRHHGGQIAWDEVAAGHVVLLTFTTDNKALIQDIKYTNGNTVISTPSFVKQLSGLPALGTHFLAPHMRGRIKSLGNGRVLVMVPASWQAITVSNGTASGAFGSVTAYNRWASTTIVQQQTQFPKAYSCVLMEKDVSGNYKMLSSVDIDTSPNAPVASVVQTSTNFPMWVDVISPTSIRVIRSAQNLSTNTGAGPLVAWEVMLNITGDIITQASSGSMNTSGAPSTAFIYNVFDVRSKKGANGKAVNIFTHVNRASYLSAYWSIPQTELRKDYYSAYTPYVNATQLGTRLTPAGFVPFDDVSADKYFHIGGGASMNMCINDVLSSAGQEIFSPLDAAWVTDNVVCIVGHPSLVIDPCFETDASMDIGGAGLYPTILPLHLSFREVAGVGAYVSPTDMLQTPYFFKYFENCGNMICRISNTEFFIIGCFRDSVSSSADPKIGVITVKV